MPDEFITEINGIYTCNEVSMQHGSRYISFTFKFRKVVDTLRWFVCIYTVHRYRQDFTKVQHHPGNNNGDSDSRYCSVYILHYRLCFMRPIKQTWQIKFAR